MNISVSLSWLLSDIYLSFESLERLTFNPCHKAAVEGVTESLEPTSLLRMNSFILRKASRVEESGKIMTDSCIECGKKLKTSEMREGFCIKCQTKINNDFRINDEFFDEKEVFIENIFER